MKGTTQNTAVSIAMSLLILDYNIQIECEGQHKKDSFTQCCLISPEHDSAILIDSQKSRPATVSDWAR